MFVAVGDKVIFIRVTTFKPLKLPMIISVWAKINLLVSSSQQNHRYRQIIVWLRLSESVIHNTSALFIFLISHDSFRQTGSFITLNNILFSVLLTVK